MDGKKKVQYRKNVGQNSGKRLKSHKFFLKILQSNISFLNYVTPPPLLYLIPQLRLYVRLKRVEGLNQRISISNQVGFN